MRDAITSLSCMEHRGGCGADHDSGDGAGLMTEIPWELFSKWFKEQNLAPLDKSNTGVGMVFLPRNKNAAAAAKTGD